MAHWSENTQRLNVEVSSIQSIFEIAPHLEANVPNVYLLRYPPGRTAEDAAQSNAQFTAIAKQLQKTHEESVICILTTPPDAAQMIPHFGQVARFQLWIAVKTKRELHRDIEGRLNERHLALLIFSRYKGSLKHTKTRIQYTYCPSCGKTTKDYGGKKHIYHEYGTLMSDVWRDFAYNPLDRNDLIEDRLRDLFGLEPYTSLKVIDMANCADLKSATSNGTQNTQTDAHWQESNITLTSGLVNDDCLEVLKEIPDDSVDFCFADPPYNIKKKYDNWNDELELVEYFKWCDAWLAELARVLKPGRTLAVLNIPLYAARHYQFLCTALRFQSWIVWEGLSLPVRMIMPAHYGLLCFSKESPRQSPGLSSGLNKADAYSLYPMEEHYCLRSTCVKRRYGSDRGELTDLWCDIHRLKHNSSRVDHPCQLPPMLMRRLYALYTQPGELVLDPFNGAGTSTLVAEQMGRRFIGIELSTQYHNLAVERHQMIADGRNPFAKTNNIPKAKNSRVERLQKQDYIVPKKTLQLDVRRIAKSIGRLPSREEVAALSRYPIEYFDKYFISWGEVCAAARTTGMSEVSPEQLNAQIQLTLFTDNSE